MIMIIMSAMCDADAHVSGADVGTEMWELTGGRWSERVVISMWCISYPLTVAPILVCANCFAKPKSPIFTARCSVTYTQQEEQMRYVNPKPDACQTEVYKEV
jgi:hypothetical protein